MPELPRPVEVLADGRWLRGRVLAQRRSSSGWRALVDYRDPATGLSFYHWRGAADLRPPQL